MKCRMTRMFQHAWFPGYKKTLDSNTLSFLQLIMQAGAISFDISMSSRVLFIWKLEVELELELEVELEVELEWN